MIVRQIAVTSGGSEELMNACTQACKPDTSTDDSEAENMELSTSLNLWLEVHSMREIFHTIRISNLLGGWLGGCSTLEPTPFSRGQNIQAERNYLGLRSAACITHNGRQTKALIMASSSLNPAPGKTFRSQ